MVVAWLLFPLVLLAVCLGCGLAVERVAGWLLPGALLLPVGLALVIVTVTLTTTNRTTAPLSTAIVVALAVAGYASSWRRLRTLRPEPWAAAVGVGVFAVCAAPVVLSGNATFLGYFVDNDSPAHFALIDQLLSRGQDIGVPYSSYAAILHVYLGTSYPTGADVALGALRPLVAQDLAWLFQPYLAVVLAFGALAIYELIRTAVLSAPLRAACAFIAAQSGLVYAFYLEASIKELVTTGLITTTVALVVATLRGRAGPRGAIPLAITAIAALDVLQLAVVPWLGVPIAVFLLISGWRVRHALRGIFARRRLALEVLGTVVLAGALAAPILSKASRFFSVATSVLGASSSTPSVTGGSQLGNLLTPLSKWQMLGIWPGGDFRYPTTHFHLGFALMGVALGGAALGIVWMIRRRAFAPLLLLAGTGIAAIYLLNRSSPYASAKVMMIFSLTVVLMAMLGAAALHSAGRRLEGWLLALVIGGGVLWTNALQYQYASVAPRARLAELASIGTRFSGQGRSFYNQVDEIAIHFLRTVQPDDPAYGPVVTRPGLPPRSPAQFREPWDPDDLALSYLDAFRLLVIGRSPRISRPPANFTLVHRGDSYDVWRRGSTPQVLVHIPLGGKLYPESLPSCRLVLATARRAASEHARLAYVVRHPPPTLVRSEASRPPNWGTVQGDPFLLIPRQQSGRLTGTVHVQHSGRYQVWLEAAVSQHFPVWVGRRLVGATPNELGPPGQFVQIGEVTLAAGTQPVEIVRPAPNLAPGQDGTDRLLGPLMLVAGTDPPPVAEIVPSRARTLCGQPLDWLEIVR
jgi:hypothetical protein